MTKTTNYNLNKPEAGDPMRLADFNENADIIDAALGNLNTAMGQMAVPKIAVGTYKGTTAGTSATFEITVGFRPKAIIAWGIYSSAPQSPTPSYSAMAVDGQNFTNALEITDSGFKAISYYHPSYGQQFPDLNNAYTTYLYFAIG